jgi:hypothetical protein
MKDQINRLFISFQMLDRLGVQGDIYSTVFTGKYFIKASQIGWSRKWFFLLTRNS